MKVIPITADVRNPDQVKVAIDEMVDRVGLPHVVINNAAGNFISPTERLSSNAFSTIVAIVLGGTANVTLDLGKRLIKAKQGEPKNNGLACSTCGSDQTSWSYAPLF